MLVSYDPRDMLILRLADLLATRLTRAGHLAQVVTHEHRGVCSVRGCAPSCREARAALTDAAEHLETVIAEWPGQLTLLEVS